MADDLDEGRRAPGWHRDPWRRHAGRYWDGQQWTEYVVNEDRVRDRDPIPQRVLDALPESERPRAAAPPARPAPVADTRLMSAPSARHTTDAILLEDPEPPRPITRRAWDGFRSWPRWAQWTAGIVAALFVIGAASGGDDDKARTIVGDAGTTTSQLLETTVPPPAEATATTTATIPATIPATTAAPAPETTAATVPATTVATVAPTAPATAPPTTRAVIQGVTPGAFCSGSGASGVTNTGLAMTCTTSATDSRNRWRAS
jgi:hypothetical protein